MRGRLPRRVGVITTSYPTSDADPAGGFVAAHCNLLRAAGCELHIIAAASSQQVGPLSAPAANLRIDGGELFNHGGAPDALEARMGVAAWAGAASFSARLTSAVLRHRAQWDGVIAHWLLPCALAALPSRGPMLAIAHGGDVHLMHRLGLVIPTVAALAARRARIVFVNHAARAGVQAELPSKLAQYLDRAATVIPMGIHVERFAALAAGRVIQPSARPRVLVVARHVAIKGVDVVLDTLAHLASPIHLVIVGDGPLHTSLQAHGAAQQPRYPHHHIEFTGALSPMQRDREYQRAAIVVVPSRQLDNGRCEGLPQVALEALACGLPLVATRTGGLADLPAPVTLCAADSPAQLAAAIAHVLAAPPNSQACMSLANQFAWPNIHQRLLEHWLHDK